MISVIVGYGEIGKAVEEVIGGADYRVDPAFILEVPEKPIDVMHVCFPYSDSFVKSVQDYIFVLKPKHVVVYSTVPIGTTGNIERAVHSPVEGKHPDLALSIRQMERWIGHNDKEEGMWFSNYFSDLGLRTRLVENTGSTEALKLLSTAEYGVNLVFADYKAYVAEAIGMDYELTKEWNREYNKLYRSLGMDKRIQKFVLDPPGGKIGGHCVVPNAKLLYEQFPDTMIEIIGEMS